MEPNTRNPQMFPGRLPTLCSFPPVNTSASWEHAVHPHPPPLPGSSFRVQPRHDAHAPALTRALAIAPPLPQPPPLPPRPRRLSPPVAPLPQEDKLPVRTTAFRGIHITGKTKVSRSRGVVLKLFIVLSPPLVPSLAVVHFVLPTCNKGTCQPPSHL